MEKTQKLEAAWWWARNARLAALRQKREEHGDPHNPLRALPGREAEFEAATELSQSMGVILKALEREIAPLGIASWQRPKGGYFVSFNAMPCTAKRTLALCREAGVTMTSAGATFPYGKDPKDSNIRIAPTYPTSEDMAKATDIFVLCVKLVSVEKLLQA